ncbi:MAG: LptE family protein [Acidobacteriota bacterium]|nr:MAG: LptE family protein [Acidobacteriota bacterium]
MFSKIGRIVMIGLLLISVSGFGECYKPAGRGDSLPKHIRTLAIPPFQNPSLRYKVEQRFTAAMVDEVLRRARALEVTADASGADAVMNGTIKNFGIRPVLLDDFGRARLFEITITAGLTVRDQTRNKIIFDNQNYIFRGEYEVSGDPQTFFTEEGPAVERIARDFAKSVLTTILEGF